MGKMTVCYCDLCKTDLDERQEQVNMIYCLPFKYEPGVGRTIQPCSNMNLCVDCATRIRDFCKGLNVGDDV